MWSAGLWGGVAGSAVFLGALAGLLFHIKKRWIAAIMAFGTGTLLGAATFELLQGSIIEGGIRPTVTGFITGALLFTLIDLYISHKGGKERKRSKEGVKSSAGLAIFFGTVFDAIPESVIIGLSLLKGETVSYLLVAAIFISNFPEGLSSSVGLKKDGYSKTKILILWSTVVVLSAISSLSGFLFLKHASHTVIAGIGSFAAGGVVAMVSSTMMPEAYEEGGPIVGFISSLGLISSLLLSYLD